MLANYIMESRILLGTTVQTHLWKRASSSPIKSEGRDENIPL